MHARTADDDDDDDYIYLLTHSFNAALSPYGNVHVYVFVSSYSHWTNDRCQWMRRSAPVDQFGKNTSSLMSTVSKSGKEQYDREDR